MSPTRAHFSLVRLIQSESAIFAPNKNALDLSEEVTNHGNPSMFTVWINQNTMHRLKLRLTRCDMKFLLKLRVKE